MIGMGIPEYEAKQYEAKLKDGHTLISVHSRDGEEAKLQDMAKQGVTVTRDVDKESFKKAMAPVYGEFSAQFSKAEIEAIMNAK